MEAIISSGVGKRQAPEQVQVVKEEQSVAVETKSVSEEKYKSVKVSSEECRRLTDKLEKIMHKDKLYKHSDLKNSRFGLLPLIRLPIHFLIFSINTWNAIIMIISTITALPSLNV